jgi:NAD-dependent DNA ligase
MNGQTAKRIRKHVVARNPGLFYLLKEEYGEEVLKLESIKIYKLAKKLYNKKPFLKNILLTLGIKVIQEEIEKENKI